MRSAEQTKKSRTDLTWIVLIIVLGCVSRIPFASHILFHWDAVNFALALDKFDLSVHQPQPPGYILNVLLGRGVNLLFNDPQKTFVFLNITFSILTAISLYFLGKIMFRQEVGAISSLLILFSPLFWFYSENAVPNIIDPFIVTLIVFFFYKTAQGEERSVFIAAILLGISGGIRQQTIVFMAPLAVYAVYKLKFTRMVLAGFCTVAVFLLSFVFMINLSGGLDNYTAAMNGLQQSFFTQTSLFMGGGILGVISNIRKLVTDTLYALFLGIIPLMVALLMIFKKNHPFWRCKEFWFLLIWISPPILFYSMVHMGSHWLIFTYLPALILLVAASLVHIVESFQRTKLQRMVWLSSIVSGMLIANILVFLAAPDVVRLGSFSFNILNHQTIKNTDRFYKSRFDLIKHNYVPDDIVIFSSKWRHGQYYLPEFTVVSTLCIATKDTNPESNIVWAKDGRYQLFKGGDLHDIPSIKGGSLVFFDRDSLCVLNDEAQTQLQEVKMDPADDSIYVYNLTANENVTYLNERLTITTK